MAEFFKQLLAQLSAIWQKLSLQQKVITVALVTFTAIGLMSLVIWTANSAVSGTGSSGSPAGYKTLYSDLELNEAGQIIKKLDDGRYKYKIENEGRTIMVDAKKVYEVRMSLARDGLPKSHGVGYEIFDKTNLAMTDFVQKVNARRALEGELQRTIEGLDEVKSVRVHIVIPEPTIFLDNQKDAKASIVVRTVPGRDLPKDKVRGIMFLVSSSVEGLKPENIAIVDFEGKLLTSPFSGDPSSMASSQNVELQQNVERYLENKAAGMLEGVLGPGKSNLKVSLDMDFDRVERTLEQFDPESKVVRSEERTDENVKNAPDGDQQKEKSLTNYEINKTVEHVIGEIGNIKRMTVSVVVDGKYEKGKDGKPVYVARTTDDIGAIENIVKNAVGYDVARGDQIAVTNLHFDNEFVRDQREEMKSQDDMEFKLTVAKYAALFILAILLILFLRSVAKTIADALNPPVPRVELLGMPEDVPVEVPEELRRSSEILERVEMLTREEPINIASIIREWLREIPVGVAPAKSGSKGKN